MFRYLRVNVLVTGAATPSAREMAFEPPMRFRVLALRAMGNNAARPMRCTLRAACLPGPGAGRASANASSDCAPTWADAPAARAGRSHSCRSASIGSICAARRAGK